MRFRILFSIAGKEDQGLRFFMKYTGGPPSVSDMLYFLVLLKAETDSVLPALIVESVILTGYVGEDLSSSSGATADLTDDTPGTLAAGDQPNQVAVVSSYEISRRYRGGHPRSYWPLGDSGQMSSDSTWSTTFVNSCQSAIASVLDSLPAATSGSTTIDNHCNVSYYEGFTSVENPITHRYRNVPTLRGTPLVDTVNSIVVRNYIGSMRKRRPKTS